MSDREDNAGDTYPQGFITAKCLSISYVSDFGTPQSTPPSIGTPQSAPPTPSSPQVPSSPLHVIGTPQTPGHFTPQVPLVEATPRTQTTPLSQITQRLLCITWRLSHLFLVMERLPQFPEVTLVDDPPVALHRPQGIPIIIILSHTAQLRIQQRNTRSHQRN